MASVDGARSLIREHGPMALFAATTIGGMVFIWTAKLYGWSLFTVTTVPLVLMAIYFVASLAFAGFRLQNEQAGDNLYYMGFLFTLSSLGVSLYLFAGETSIDTIVRNFGIAVTSTIAGITLRILFNQMRRDPMDIERSVRHELSEMTRKVRAELDSSAREFSNYRRVSNQMLAEGFEEITRQAERNGDEIRKMMEALSREAIKPIQDAADKLTSIIESHNRVMNDRSDDAAARLTETTEKLSGIIDRFGDTVETVGKRLEGIRSPDDVIRLELTPAIESIRQMTETHLKRVEEEARKDEAFLAQTKDALQPLERLESRLETLTDAVNGAGRQGNAFTAERRSESVLPAKEPGSGNGSSPEGERKRWFGW